MPVFFFFNDTATTEIYTLSLHDALPIFVRRLLGPVAPHDFLEREHAPGRRRDRQIGALHPGRSEEHTSELQSLAYLVCRLLLEKKNNEQNQHPCPKRPPRSLQTNTRCFH